MGLGSVVSLRGKGKARNVRLELDYKPSPFELIGIQRNIGSPSGFQLEPSHILVDEDLYAQRGI